MRINWTALWLAAYPTLHLVVLPIVLRRLRMPTEDEKGVYAMVFDLLNAVAAGHREKPITSMEVVKTQTTNVTVTPTEGK